MAEKPAKKPKWSDDNRTCVLTVELPQVLDAVTVTCEPTTKPEVGPKLSTFVRDVNPVAVQGSTSCYTLTLTGLHPRTSTGYNFTVKDGQEVLGKCRQHKKGGQGRRRSNGEPAPAPAPAPGAAGPAPMPPTAPAAPAAAPAAATPVEANLEPSIDQLIADTRKWFRVEDDEDSVNRTRDKGDRFERFMAWFMRFVWNRESGGFESVTCTGRSHDRGRDIVCVPMNRLGHGSRRDHVIVNCKNYKSNYSPDLVYTMYGRLISSGFDSTGEERYSTAIAAVHPQFTRSTPLVGDLIEEFNRVSPERRLHYLEWCGEGTVHGISAKLKIKLRDDTELKEHFHYCYLDKFQLDEGNHPKEFNREEYTRLLVEQSGGATSRD